MTFVKAIKHESRLRLALAGPAGSGKTYTALLLATSLAEGKPIAVIDTERGSASKYADLYGFDVSELSSPYHPNRFVEAIHEAEAAGYAVLIIDSLSLAWNGPGGLLEIVEGITKRSQHKNSYIAWGEATPIQNRLIDAMTNAKLHLIVTLRSKQDYAQEKDEKTGKTVIRKLGMAPIQRDGLEYEFDVFADMTLDNEMIVQKSRCSALAGQVIAKPGASVATTLKEWLAGAPVEEKPAPVAQPKPQPASGKPAAQPPAAPAQAAKPIDREALRKLAVGRLGYTDDSFEDLLQQYSYDGAVNLRQAKDHLNAELAKAANTERVTQDVRVVHEPAPADDSGPSNEQQQLSIHKLSIALGREEPDSKKMTFNQAAAVIRQMSRDYNAQRRAS